MKRLTLPLLAAGAALVLPLRSQSPAPAPAAAAKVTPIVLAGTPVTQLQTLRDQNKKLLDQQAAALQKLEEMEKVSQALKILGKRS